MSAVLTQDGVASLPEVHCDLTYAERRIGATGSGTAPTALMTPLLYGDTYFGWQLFMLVFAIPLQF